MLSSHELARMILAHRDTNIIVEVCITNDKNESITALDTNLRDHVDVGDYREPHWITSDSVVVYSPLADAIVIRANDIHVGSLCEGHDD